MRSDAQVDSAVSESPLASERQRLMRDAVANNLSAPVSAIVGILLVPFMLKALGLDDYGLWIVAASMSGIIGAVDFGLHWSVIRVVAADPAGSEGGNADFVRSAANVYLLIGVAGCLVLGGAGLLSADRLGLPPVAHETVTRVFWLVGATLCADRLDASGNAVLAGLRRFDLLNIIASISSIAWGVGALAILMCGGGVVYVAACQLAVTVVRSAATLWLAARLSPRFRFRPFFLRWGALRRHASFAASSLLTDVLGNITWNSAPALIGFLGGSAAAAVPFYIGQKFPVAVSGMSCRAAEVLYPAASENRQDLVKSREILRVGSRWVLVLTLPFAVLLFVAAPSILRAWVGNPSPGSVAIMRVMVVTMLAEGVRLTPVYLLWGRGAMKPILVTSIAQGLCVLALCLGLVYKFGAVGAAWGMLVPIAAGSVALFVVASRACEIDPLKLAADVWRGLTLPVLACLLGVLSALYLRNDSRVWVALVVAAGGLSYLAVLFGFSGNEDEKRFARDTLSRLKHSATFIYRRYFAGSAPGGESRGSGALKRLVRMIPGAKWAYRNSVYLFQVAREQCFDDWRQETDESRVNTEWEYEWGIEQERYQLVLSVVNNLQADISRASVLEIGCYCGVFTARLAESCASVTACDMSPVARELAARRCRDFKNVVVREIDISRDEVQGKYDIVFAMDVLEYVHGRKTLLNAVDKLLNVLRPEGLLVFTDVRLAPVLRDAWWQRWFPEGADAVMKLISKRPAVRLEHWEFHPGDGLPSGGYLAHVIAVFRKESV